MCGNTCPPSWHNLAHIFEHGSTWYLKTINSHSSECTSFSDLNTPVLQLILISLPLYISTWSHLKYQGQHGLEKKCQQEKLHSNGNISKTSAHLGPESEKNNWKHTHLVDVCITRVNVCFFFLPSGISLEIIHNYVTVLYDIEFGSKTKQAQGLASSVHSFF